MNQSLDIWRIIVRVLMVSPETNPQASATNRGVITSYNLMNLV